MAKYAFDAPLRYLAEVKYVAHHRQRLINTVLYPYGEYDVAVEETF